MPNCHPHGDEGRWRMRPMLAALMILAAAVAAAGAQAAETRIVVDVTAPGRPLPHFWERMFGSGRAVLSLRESYRDDMRAVRKITDFRYVRFHAILHDEVGLYSEDKKTGEPVYNFSYIDQIYDGLLANGVRPFVELSFMPAQLTPFEPDLTGRNLEVRQGFWYRPVVSPPKDYGRWDALISAFARHLIERYGIEEVSQWYFEVWNEPNLDFWAGSPKQSTYWTLYDHTARALKAVDTRLRVGGPATAQAAWVAAFIEHCRQEHVPVDFTSTHVYGDDTAQDVFGTTEKISREHMVCRAVRKVHEEIRASAMPSLPLIWSEFNASYTNYPEVTDAPYMGPWLAETIRQCDGLVQDMSYWTFSDVFEEGGVVKKPFYGGFGLLAAGGIPKPSFNAFALLHQLGEERFSPDTEGALLTRRHDGTLVLAVWNYREAKASDTAARKVTLEIKHSGAGAATVQSIDGGHGNVNVAYEKMGSPRNPTREQLAELRAAGALPAAVTRPLEGGTLTLEIPSDGLTLVTIGATASSAR
jgi:xylan 1,4-beta-xylosidase